MVSPCSMQVERKQWEETSSYEKKLALAGSVVTLYSYACHNRVFSFLFQIQKIKIFFYYKITRNDHK